MCLYNSCDYKSKTSNREPFYVYFLDPISRKTWFLRALTGWSETTFEIQVPELKQNLIHYMCASNFYFVVVIFSQLQNDQVYIIADVGFDWLVAGYVEPDDISSKTISNESVKFNLLDNRKRI